MNYNHERNAFRLANRKQRFTITFLPNSFSGKGKLRGWCSFASKLDNEREDEVPVAMHVNTAQLAMLVHTPQTSLLRRLCWDVYDWED